MYLLFQQPQRPQGGTVEDGKKEQSQEKFCIICVRGIITFVVPK